VGFNGKAPSMMAWGRRAAFSFVSMDDIFLAFEAVFDRRPDHGERIQIGIGVDHFIRLAGRHPDRNDLYAAVRTCESNERAATARRNFTVVGSRSAQRPGPAPRRNG